jgi:hypothetical protein
MIRKQHGLFGGFLGFLGLISALLMGDFLTYVRYCIPFFLISFFLYKRIKYKIRIANASGEIEEIYLSPKYRRETKELVDYINALVVES